MQLWTQASFFLNCSTSTYIHVLPPYPESLLNSKLIPIDPRVSDPSHVVNVDIDPEYYIRRRDHTRALGKQITSWFPGRIFRIPLASLFKPSSH
jgi:hypothetical protein